MNRIIVLGLSNQLIVMSRQNSSNKIIYISGYKRKIITIFLILITTLSLKAQWSGTNPVWTNSNVGIGISTPSYPLDVRNATGQFQLKSSTGTNYVVARFNNTGGDLLIGRERSTGAGLLPSSAAYSSFLNSLGAYPFHLAVNNSIAMTILDGTKIGIGITNPQATLHTFGATPIRVETSSGNSRGGVELASTYYGGVATGYYLYPGGATIGNNAFGENANNLYQVNISEAGIGSMKIGMVGAGITQLYTNSLPRLTVLGNGNIGIGAISPSSVLEINRTSAAYWNGSSGYTSGPNSAGLIVANTGPGGYDPAIILKMATSTGVLGESAIIGTVGTGPWTNGNNATQISDLYIATRNSNGGVSERMRISATGNVGIGTVSPGYKLEIKDGGLKINNTAGPAELIMVGGQSGAVSYAIRNQRTGISNTGFEIYDASNNVSRIAIDGSGNIGIGTSSPESLLHINSTLSNTIKTVLSLSNPLGTTALNNGVALTLGNSASTYYTKIATVFEGQNPSYLQPALVFYTMRDSYLAGSEVERMRITSGGNVGIGIIDPGSYKLNVNGRVRANEVVVNTSGADFVFDLDYKMLSLKEIEIFIKENKHLPDIQPASEMKENGMNVSEMQTKLLQKIEELTLYVIELKNEIEDLKKK